MNETELTNLSISKRQLKVFFRFYCTKSEYTDALKLGAQRLDLNGNPASLVTENELVRNK
jgi:sRNA-binding protein